MATFLAKINNFNLDFGSKFNEARWHEFCKKNQNKIVHIDKPIPIRSLSQNALYWVWLEKVELETGNDKNDLHEYLKMKFLPKRIIKIKSKGGQLNIQTYGTTTKLSKIEFGEYLDKCAQHTGVALPTEEEIAELGYIKN